MGAGHLDARELPRLGMQALPGLLRDEGAQARLGGRRDRREPPPSSPTWCCATRAPRTCCPRPTPSSSTRRTTCRISRGSSSANRCRRRSFSSLRATFASPKRQHARESAAMGDAALAVERRPRPSHRARPRQWQDGARGAEGARGIRSRELDTLRACARAAHRAPARARGARRGDSQLPVAGRRIRGTDCRVARSRRAASRGRIRRRLGQRCRALGRGVPASRRCSTPRRSMSARIFRAQMEGAERAWIFTSAMPLGERRLLPLPGGDRACRAETRSWPSPYDFERRACSTCRRDCPTPTPKATWRR